MWGTVLMMGAQLLMSAKATGDQNDALEDEQADRTSAGQLKVNELARQQDRANLVATETKSDIALAMDVELGSILAASADGGRTTASTAALAGALAATSAKDLARVESNRKEAQHPRRASAVSIVAANKAHGKATKQKTTANNISFFGNALGTISSSAAFKKATSPTPTMTPGGGGPTLGPGMSGLTL